MQQSNIPTHVGIIMDGNGRWAKKRGLPRSAGHRKGADIIGDVVKAARDMGVKYVTLYAFSTENWSRPAEEIESIMKLLREYLSKVDRYKGENVRSLFIGDRTQLADDIVDRMAEIEEASKHHDGLTLTIAINYGGQDEITNAVREIARQVKVGELRVGEITKDTIESHLYTRELPPLDLVIRPSGELRISNFLLWQIAYSELVFMDILWPDFTAGDFKRAVAEYASRTRRFGGI